MPESDPVIERALAEASGPGLAPGAAGRIADGAWRRAAELRASRTPRFRVFGRLGFLTAAAAAIVGALVVFRRSEAAFAVEGDPVMVRRGGGWTSSLRVAADELVKIPDGVRALRWSFGGVLRPRPGTVLQFARADSSRQVRVEFKSGGAEVDGSCFLVSMPGDALVERDPSSGVARFEVRVGDLGAPEVSVGEGSVFLRTGRARSSLQLANAERAALVPLLQGASTQMTWTKIAPWSPAAAATLEHGVFRVLDAQFVQDGQVALLGSAPGCGTFGIEVPPAQMPEVVNRINLFARVRVAVTAGGSPARYVYEKDGASVVVTVDATGAARVQQGRDERCFRDLAALRRDAPEVAALFGDALR